MEGKGLDKFLIVKRERNSQIQPGLPVLLVHPSDVRTHGRHDEDVFGIHLHTLPKKFVKRLYAEVAKERSSHQRIFQMLRVLHTTLAVLYAMLIVGILAIVLVYPFNTSAGTCLESVYPLPYLIIILLLMYCIEEIIYCVFFGRYITLLLRWKNTFRWKFRAYEAALIFTFIISISCSLDLPNLIAIALFLIGGTVNFGYYEHYVAKRHASRALTSHYIRTNDVRRLAVLQIKEISVSSLILVWSTIFIPTLPPLFDFVWRFISNAILYTNDVTLYIWITYAAGIIQMIGVLTIPMVVYRYKNNNTLYRAYLYGDMAYSILLFITKVVMMLSYVGATRLF